MASAARTAFVDGLHDALPVATCSVAGCGILVVALLLRGHRDPVQH